MSIARTYILHAAEAQAAAMHAAATALATAVRGIPGCEGVTLLVDRADPGRAIFIERFAGPEAQAASAAHMDKGLMAALGRTLAKPWDGATCDYLVEV